MKIYIEDFSGKAIVHYALQLVAQNKGFVFTYVREANVADLRFGIHPGADVRLSNDFFELINRKEFRQESHFLKDCFIRHETGEIDHLSTIFYCVNCLQEYTEDAVDAMGRFDYSYSYQKRFSNIFENHVQSVIDDFVSNHSKLSQLKSRKRPSVIYLSHDIDTVHGALLEDGLYNLKKLSVNGIYRILRNALTGKPDWRNMDKIRNMEAAKGYRSIFFWLLYRDRMNSDYKFDSGPIQQELMDGKKEGFENGIHKSLRDLSFREEISRFGDQVLANRYHYLKFKLPDAWQELCEAGIQLDTSLGFSNAAGFRNSYGLPFIPFDLKANAVFPVLEVPMHIMDRTFFMQGKMPEMIFDELVQQLDKLQDNCVVTLNFHNNFFSPYKYDGYEKLYERLLQWFSDKGMKHVSSAELIREFYQPDWFKIKED